MGCGEWANHVHFLSHAHVLGVGWCGLLFVPHGRLPHGLGGRGNGLLRAHWAAKQTTFWSAHNAALGSALWPAYWPAVETAQWSAINAALEPAIKAALGSALISAHDAAIESTYAALGAAFKAA